MEFSFPEVAGQNPLHLSQIAVLPYFGEFSHGIDHGLGPVELPGMEIEHEGRGYVLVPIRKIMIHDRVRQQAQITAARNRDADAEEGVRGCGELVQRAARGLVFERKTAVRIYKGRLVARVVQVPFFAQDVQGPEMLFVKPFVSAPESDDRIGAGVLQGAARAPQIVPELIGCHLAYAAGRIPGVGDFVPFGNDPFDDRGVFVGDPPEREKSSFDIE